MDDQQTGGEPDPEVLEAFARQLFRSENPPDVLWDTALFERMGRSINGLKVADAETKAAYRARTLRALADTEPNA
ncbi:hypothetical protein ACFQI3_02765 [Hansschlegelia quercus]|uniref:Uncharacterized protein n=1 Tax=Hansschlegelia quercus TaxID=2528245 RepID=A0A4Q9GPX0_9HYPH|nr:hypothetical protein [Hansschlegelia quercus]TBN54844.1 hypothetical protein EYR15_01390 [Hansschlegelia quercus]